MDNSKMIEVFDWVRQQELEAEKQERRDAMVTRWYMRFLYAAFYPVIIWEAWNYWGVIGKLLDTFMLAGLAVLSYSRVKKWYLGKRDNGKGKVVKGP